jgi:hypothetical protein
MTICKYLIINNYVFFVFLVIYCNWLIISVFHFFLLIKIGLPQVGKLRIWQA